MPMKLRLLLVAVLAAAGCQHDARTDVWSTPFSLVRIAPDRYRIHAALSPDDHTLTADVTMTAHSVDPVKNAHGPVAVEFELHRDLEIAALTADGRAALSVMKSALGDDDDADCYARYIVLLPKAADAFELRFEYQGQLLEDYQAGEKPGAIHNFEVRSHVGPEGVYLAGESRWYPIPVQDDSPLADFDVTVDRVAGLELVGCGNPADGSSETAAYHWQSPFPMDGFALVGGKHVIHSRTCGHVLVEAHVAEANSRHAAGLLDAAEHYLQIYEPLIGDYPFKRFTVVENFFSSGFAFPGFTVLGPRVIAMGKHSLRPGYLDHELVHNWWGNGVMVDPEEGNWCEALTSYCANYYRRVTEGDTDSARKYRRDSCNDLSRIKAKHDLPLGRFGLEGSPSSGVGYRKGAMVFHMLARKIGQERFWNCLRIMGEQRVGLLTGWTEIKELFEAEADIDLARFFDDWVYGTGAPVLTLERAEYDPTSQALEVQVSQNQRDFDLDVPLRIHHADGRTEDHVVHLGVPSKTFSIEQATVPQRVELDPDYHVFRRLPVEQLMPTISFVTGSPGTRFILPDGDISKPHQTVLDRYLPDEEGEDHPPVHNRKKVSISEVTGDELTGLNLFVLGNAALDSRIAELLQRANCPVVLNESSFKVGDTLYDQPNQSALVTVHHPDLWAGVITVYFANSDDGWGKARVIGFYGGNSLIVFDGNEAVYRQDLEANQSLNVAN